MKNPLALLVAVSSSLCSGCFLSDISKPVSVGGLVERTTPPTRLIPSRDLEFLVQRLPKKVVVTITSKNWQIEGFGTGDLGGSDGNRELIFHSICGYRKQRGSTETYTSEAAPRIIVNVYLQDRIGRRLLTKPNKTSLLTPDPPPAPAVMIDEPRPAVEASPPVRRRRTRRSAKK